MNKIQKTIMYGSLITAFGLGSYGFYRTIDKKNSAQNVQVGVNITLLGMLCAKIYQLVKIDEESSKKSKLEKELK
ncbi:MAG: hypothetical protein WC812_02645 [Candidatus Pacearchaeota archaeon]|jgi:ABC-type proline/glycine betaine transport system permease subunit